MSDTAKNDGKQTATGLTTRSETNSGSSARPARRGRFVGLMLIIALVVAAVDQGSKQYILSILNEGESLPIIGDWARFYLLFNPGAAFSMGEGSTWLFTTIQLAFVLGVAVTARRVGDRYQAIGLALLAGGALGNLIDRLFRAPGFWFGHVVDFISIGRFAVFNVADSAITCGVVIFVLAMLTEDARASRSDRGAAVAGADLQEGEHAGK